MESRVTVPGRVLVCGLVFLVTTGCLHTPEPVDPITPLMLDVAPCAVLDPRVVDGPPMERVPLQISDPNDLLVQLETLQRQLADAADANAADLIRRSAASDLAGDAAYVLTLVPNSRRCRGEISCRIGNQWGPIASFLTANPDSSFAPAAVERALTAFGAIETERDLRVAANSLAPSELWALVESLDGVGRMLPVPHGTRLLERAAQLWWQLSDYERADAAYRAAQTGATPEVRSCLDARLDAVPDAWLTLDPTKVIHPRRIDLNWQLPNTVVLDFVVYRSPAASELGVAVERLPADAHTWTDTGTVPGGAYWYRVVAELPDGVLQSNPSPAVTPPLTQRVRGVAVSTRDEYLHVFGRLRNGFPQVIRLAPDGSVFERRDGLFIGVGDRESAYDSESPFAPYVDEVWLADHGGLGVLSFRGATGRLPATLLSAVRQGGAYFTDYPRTDLWLVASVDEAENAAWIAGRRGSPSAVFSIDCVGPLSICWFGRASEWPGWVLLQDQTGQTITTIERPGANQGDSAEQINADPRDGSAWVLFESGRLLHYDRGGVTLADLSLAEGSMASSVTMTADFDHDRVIWFTRRRPDRQTELVRIDVDDPALRQEIVAVDVPSLPKMAPDLNGGVWLVTDNEALRIDDSGRTIVRAPLDGPNRP